MPRGLDTIAALCIISRGSRRCQFPMAVGALPVLAGTSAGERSDSWRFPVTRRTLIDHICIFVVVAYVTAIAGVALVVALIQLSHAISRIMG